MGRVSKNFPDPGSPVKLHIGSFWLICALRNLAPALLCGTEEDSMLQLLDLARENAELQRELTRIRQEAEALQRVRADSSVQSGAGASEDFGETNR
jgi:hypothetical protein